MDPISSHLVLVSASGYDNACDQVRDFFDKTLLVRYDRIEIREESCFQGNDKHFSKTLQKGIDTNRSTLNRFISEFRKTGFEGVDDFTTVECGYPSKLLHIITHFLDGFIGIDSAFYNLVDDSHWLEESTRHHLQEEPEHYWVIMLDGYSETPETVSLVQA